MEIEVDVKSAAASVRQGAAIRRWVAATPATAEQIQEITGCGPDLASHMAGLDLRLDARARHGAQSILFPLYSRQTGGKLEVSAIQFLAAKSAHMDFMGATETRLFRNQEAAVTVLPIIPLPKDMDGKTAKRPNNLMLVMGGKDAITLNLVTGIETIALPSPRIPHHLIEQWVREQKHQIWIHGMIEWEMKEIVTRLQDVGFAGYIRWTGNPLARVMPGAEPKLDEESGGKPFLDETNAEILRDDAWVTYLAGGPDAVKALLAGSVTVHNPKKVKAPSESGSPIKNAEKALNTHRQTGKLRLPAFREDSSPGRGQHRRRAGTQVAAQYYHIPGVKLADFRKIAQKSPRMYINDLIREVYHQTPQPTRPKSRHRLPLCAHRFAHDNGKPLAGILADQIERLPLLPLDCVLSTVCAAASSGRIS